MNYTITLGPTAYVFAIFLVGFFIGIIGTVYTIYLAGKVLDAEFDDQGNPRNGS